MGDKRIYSELVRITEDFLGPAAQRFIDRQTKNHLKKEPGQLTYDELLQLTDWVKLTLALLTKDDKIKREYSRKIDQLIKASTTT